MSPATEAPTAEGLASELATLRGRRGDLDRQLREVVSAHEAAHEALIGGVGDLDAVQVALQRQTALRTALQNLDGRISDLAARHEALAASERRAQVVAALVQIAGEGEAAARRYAQINRAAQAALEPFLDGMKDALGDLISARTAFIETAHPVVSLQSHDPQTKRQAERFLAELAGRGSLETILIAWRNTPATAHDREGGLPTPGDFNLAFALQTATAQRVFG